MGRGRYGRSFADRLIHEGKYDEALRASDKALRPDEADRPAVSDPAAGRSRLEPYEESVAAYERAIELNRSSGGLEEDQIDDAYYEALRAWAVALFGSGDAVRAIAALERYDAHAPTGRHADDRKKWYEQFRGES